MGVTDIMNFSDHGDNNSKDYNAGLRDNDYRVYEMDLQCEAGYLSRPLDENWSAKIRESDPLYVKTEQGGVMTKRMLNYTLKKCLFVSALNDKLSSDWSNFLTTRSCDDLTVENKNSHLVSMSKNDRSTTSKTSKALKRRMSFIRTFWLNSSLRKKGGWKWFKRRRKGLPAMMKGLPARRNCLSARRITKTKCT